MALVLIPTTTALVTVPSLLRVYELTHWPIVCLMIAFGVLWGLGMLMIGKSYSEAGVAITNAIALGTASLVGTTVPLLVEYRDRTTPKNVFSIEIATVALAFGIVLCGMAGRARERSTTSFQGNRFNHGIMLATLGGGLTAALNAAVAYGNGIVAEVRSLCPTATMAENAIWPPVLFAGSIPGIIFSLALISKARSVGEFRRPGTKSYWLIVTMMAILWFASVSIYGLEVNRIGNLGPIVGWPVFMSGILMFSFVWSVVTGEWKGTRTRSVVLMLSGLALQAGAIGYLAEISHH